MSFLAIPILASQKPLQYGGFGQKCSFLLQNGCNEELILHW